MIRSVAVGTPSPRTRAAPAPRLTLPLAAVLVAMVAALGGWAGFQAFNAYLNVPEVVVPGLVGKPLTDAQSVARQAGVSLQVAQQINSESVPAGAVISQDPPAERRVKRGRLVAVVVSLGPEFVQVPDLRGQRAEEARFALERARLQVGETREAFDEKVPDGQVIATDPPPGTRVDRSRPVALVVSKGPPLVEVPMVLGRTLEEARRVLQAAGLEGSPAKTVPSSDTPPGTVVGQMPGPGTKVPPKSAVALTVSAAPQPAAPAAVSVDPAGPSGAMVLAQPLPPIGDERRVRLTIVVPRGREAQEVKIVVADDNDTRVVYSALHAPGDRIERVVRGRGPTLVQVYLDGRVVQEIRP